MGGTRASPCEQAQFMRLLLAAAKISSFSPLARQPSCQRKFSREGTHFANRPV